MKVTLYMAISVNGLIARTNGESDFLSEVEATSFIAAVRKAGCLVVGTVTYGILTALPEFSEIKSAKLAVVSHTDFSTLDSTHLVAHSPKEALSLLDGFDEIIIAGGATLNASFLAENLVDEIYLDIEPTILGEGIPLFKGKEFEHSLRFLGQKMLSENEIQLHYEVLRDG